MATIRKLNDKNGNRLYPQTHIEAVIGADGTTLNNLLADKQDTLISGVNVKTINGLSVLGSGGIYIDGSGEGTSMEIDDTPTSDSENLVTSGGVYNAIYNAIESALFIGETVGNI